MARTWFWAKLSQKCKVEAEVVESSDEEDEAGESIGEITPTVEAEESPTVEAEESDAEWLRLLDELTDKVETTEDEEEVLLKAEEKVEKARADERSVTKRKRWLRGVLSVVL